MTLRELAPAFPFWGPVSPFANHEQPKTRPLESIGYELQICKPSVLIFMQIGGGGVVHPLGFANRCIIPLREHPLERNRVPGPGRPYRKRDHHSRILSAFPERPGQRLQSEIEPRPGHESRRSRRPPSLAFSGRTI